MPNGGDIVVIRGLPIPIDKMRVDAFNDGIKGTKINVIDSQFGNWSRDDAFKVMQDFLTKHPKIDAVWCQDDDMAIGVFEAIAQAKRTDIKFVVGGAGSKDMVKRVMDGDPMMPVDVLYSPSMVAVAMDVTALGLEDKNPGARRLHPQGLADHQGQREGLLLQGLAVLIGAKSGRRVRALPLFDLRRSARERGGRSDHGWHGQGTCDISGAVRRRRGAVQFVRRDVQMGGLARLQGRADPGLGRPAVRPRQGRGPRRPIATRSPGSRRATASRSPNSRRI